MRHAVRDRRKGRVIRQPGSCAQGVPAVHRREESGGDSEYHPLWDLPRSASAGAEAGHRMVRQVLEAVTRAARRASIFQSKDDPEMGGIAGTPFCRLEDGDCISKPTQFQTNHSKPNQPIPTQPTTGWTGAARGGPAGPGFGAEPHLKEIFHFLID